MTIATAAPQVQKVIRLIAPEARTYKTHPLRRAKMIVWITLMCATVSRIGTDLPRRLTVKLRGRPEAPDQASRAHNLSHARGADI